jgi:hypothetical protein
MNIWSLGRPVAKAETEGDVCICPMNPTPTTTAEDATRPHLENGRKNKEVRVPSFILSGAPFSVCHRLQRRSWPRIGHDDVKVASEQVGAEIGHLLDMRLIRAVPSVARYQSPKRLNFVECGAKSPQWRQVK